MHHVGLLSRLGLDRDSSGLRWSENNLRTKFATLLSPNLYHVIRKKGLQKYFWWNSRWHDVPTCEHKNDCENKLGHSFLGLESLPVEVRKLAILICVEWNGVEDQTCNNVISQKSQSLRIYFLPLEKKGNKALQKALWFWRRISTALTIFRVLPSFYF